MCKANGVKQLGMEGRGEQGLEGVGREGRDRKRVGLRGGGGASQGVGGADGTLSSSTFWVGIQCGSPPQPPSQLRTNSLAHVHNRMFSACGEK